ncbi:MAG: TRAP transporter large permease subunit [Alphaproteobacteria bacterium]|nr:TRAP transporter large permease subunit [Alphaproteobacteria bacterium]
MSIEWLSLAIAIAIVVLMMLGVPLAFVTGSIAVVVALTMFGASGLTVVASQVFSLVNEYLFVAVPMFLLMATFLERSGVAHDLYDAMNALGRRVRGGVALQTLAVAVVLATTTGIVGGEVVLLGVIALPQMLRLGYDRKLAIGTICAGGALGAMIPPSIVLIVYGITASVSVGDLFTAAFLPGFLMAALYALYIVARCRLDPAMAPLPSSEALAAAGGGEALRKVALPLALVAAVLGSIYGGVASITEAAAVGAFGALLCAWQRGRLSFALMRDAALQTMRTCGMVLWLTFGAAALIGVYGLVGGTRFAGGLLSGLDLPPLAVVAVMMAVVFLLGMVMDWIGICLLTMPIFVPVVKALGLDPIWFGVLFCMNVQVAYLSPPFGPAAFFLKGVAPPDISLQEIFRAVLPFIGLQIVALGLVMLFPGIALWAVR